MKKFVASVLTSLLLLTTAISTSFAAESGSFVDIEKSYAKDAILELQAKGILNGTDGAHFDPQGQLTRAQFIVIMVKSLGLEIDENATSSFTDVAGWAVPYVEAALKAGIVTGMGNGKFAPNATVTREMSATILVRSLQTQGKLNDTDAVLTFTDADQISDWAKPYIALAQKYGLVKGNPDGTFNPKGKANREQAATMGSNLLQSIKVVLKENEKPSEPPAPPVSSTPPVVGGPVTPGPVTPPTPPTPDPEPPVTDPGTPTPPKSISAEFTTAPSFIGSVTSDFTVKVGNGPLLEYSLYYDGKLVGQAKDGVVTSINNLFTDVTKLEVRTNDTVYIDDSWK